MDSGPCESLDGHRPGYSSSLGGRIVARGATALVACWFTAGCSLPPLDAGSSRPHGLLPVDERNPLVVLNDGAFDNWETEYAVLLANDGGPDLAGIVVGTSGPWPDLDANVAGARDLVSAARDSGLRNIPDPIATVGDILERPASGEIDDTEANRSEGARFIVDASKRLALSYRPIVVAVGGRLTDVADAYLIDHSVTERVVVVASIGSLSSSGADMGRPNGEMDPWADTIVTSRFRYVQISAFYDQLQDVPAARISELPDNPFGDWLEAKQSGIWEIPEAADQVAVAAVGIAEFVTEVARMSPAGPVDSDASEGPALLEDPEGSGWLVRQIAGSAATERFWSILSNPATFEP
jgi:hypothetical protein